MTTTHFPRICVHLRSSAAMLVLATSMTGCTDIGAGGTGEFKVGQARLRTVDAVQLETLPSIGAAATQPFILSTTQPTTQISEVPITLAQVRQWAIQNNLELKVDLLDPTIAKENVTAEQAKFESIFTTDVRYGTTDTPFFVTDQQGNRNIAASGSEFLSIVPGLNVPLFTGGNIGLNLPINRLENDTGRIDTTTGLPVSDLQWQNDFTFTFSQPLLRGGGVDRNFASIRIAFYDYQATEARTKLRVITVLADADRQYWRLDAAIKLLAVQKNRYDSANDALNRAKRRLNAGAAVEADVVTSEAALADAASAIVAAESRLRGELRELKRVINVPEYDLNSLILLRPSEEPRYLASKLDSAALAAQAVRDRMELLEAELRILAQDEGVKLARNDLLPLLSVQYRYNVNGLGESSGDAFDLLADNDFADHSVGLQLEIPIGNEAARARLRRALARRQQELATRTLREQTVRNEVFASVQNLEQTWQAILASRQSVVAEKRVLDSEIRKFDRGESDSEDVRLSRDRLAIAQQREVEAIRDYQISQIDLAAATGSLLGLTNVDWVPIQSK